ncbi:nuclear transport factor 2 family protein [Kaistia adipata]|uniref:nuclear transport factor 2 family protein n=1 Tax=Kaistia adipata TaxID=166954 RepID=UPI000400168F|nr:nuclear transport factor 2 family protein [Kaistia adipata]
MATHQTSHPHAAMTPTVRKLADELQPLLDTLAACMDRGDARGAAALFAEDSNLISPSGMIGTGAAGVQRVIAADMQTILKASHSHFTIDSVRPLGDMAFVDATHEISGGQAGAAGTLEVHVVLLARKQGAGWKLAEARPYLFVTPPTKH